MDWELAYWRSEMLRLFKTEFLTKISHELRGPLNAQIGALELIKANLCDSIEEAQDYVEAALSKAHEHLGLIQETIAIAKWDSPIQPLVRGPVSFNLHDLYALTYLHARDRGIEYSLSAQPLSVTSDPHGLAQLGLGLSLWTIQQTLYGSVTATATDRTLQWTIQGKVKPPDHEHPYWQTPASLAKALGHTLTWQPETLSVICQF